MTTSKPFTDAGNQMREVKAGRKDEENPTDLLKELEIPERTQKPPSAELIARLNDIASRPPFSSIFKAKENDTL